MKKIFSLLLSLALMLPCALAVAEGAMTDKPLNFADFTFGDTFGEIRKTIKLTSVEFKYGAYTSRCIADALDNLPDYSPRNESVAPNFMAREYGQRNVAGYRAGTLLWFSYAEGGLTEENNAIFYAGEYEFDTNNDPNGVFADLKNKLTQLYGEPFYVGESIDEAMGGVAVVDAERYNNDVENMKADYAVWKSSANNAVVVLKHFIQYGGWERVKLAYISDVADEVLAQHVTHPGSENTNMAGL